jgi:hypothetical protein
MFVVARAGDVDGFIAMRQVDADRVQVSDQGFHLPLVHAQRTRDGKQPVAMLDRVVTAGAGAAEKYRDWLSFIREKGRFEGYLRPFCILGPNLLQVPQLSCPGHLPATPSTKPVFYHSCCTKRLKLARRYRLRQASTRADDQRPIRARKNHTLSARRSRQLIKVERFSRIPVLRFAVSLEL